MGEHTVSIKELLEKLKFGGKIVSTGGCNISEIAQARADGRMYVDEDGFGFIYMPNN